MALEELISNIETFLELSRDNLLKFESTREIKYLTKAYSDNICTLCTATVLLNKQIRKHLKETQVEHIRNLYERCYKLWEKIDEYLKALSKCKI